MEANFHSEDYLCPVGTARPTKSVNFLFSMLCVETRKTPASLSTYQSDYAFNVVFTVGLGMLPRPQGFDVVQKSRRRQNLSDG